jgi:hypothetical protein
VKHKVEIDMGRTSAHSRNGQGCPPGRWRRYRHLWRNHRVLATVVSAKEPKPGQDFFPLTVNYQEKTFAAGKIPGGFFKREGRPTEKETLTSRLIDRPIRPLFPKGYKNDTQVVSPCCPRHGKRSRHGGDGRRFGCPDAVRRALHGPDRRRARRLHQRRIRAQPAVDEMPESSSSI